MASQKSVFATLVNRKTPVVIGMLHLPALPGSPNYDGDFAGIKKRLLDDARALEAGGVHALMMENFGDVPFFPGRVPVTVVASMTALACAVREESKLPLGINVLRNDGESALAIAVACGADFVRINVLSGARVTDQGVIQGIAHDVMRLRSSLNAQHIAVMADVDVKHSAPLAARNLVDEVEDTVKRGLADAVIASGAGTGKVADPKKVAEVSRVAGVPVFLGSGVSSDNIRDYRGVAQGFIVGTAFKRGGDVRSPVDVKRVNAFMDNISPKKS